jgi:Transcriptional regulator, AbiEi antitoxin
MPNRRPSIPEAPFTTADARALGISRKTLRALTESGDVRRVFHGVYVCATVADTIHTRAAALATILPPFAVVCDRTAAWLHGVDVLTFRELGIPPPIDLVSIRDLTPSRLGGVNGGERDLDPLDITVIDGVRVTTPLRTALDLGCKLTRYQAIGALDQFMRLHGITRRDFDAHLPRYRGRRGVIQLRLLVTLASPFAESPGESWIRLVIYDANLPAPTPQFSVRVGGAELFRLDLAYEYHRVCVEYDGVEFHTTPAQIAADQRRRRWLADHGWTVIVVTKDDLGRDSTRDWISRLRAALN